MTSYDQTTGEQVAEIKRFHNLQALAALAGAELSRTSAGAFVVRRGDYSIHCHELETAAQAINRMSGTHTPPRKATP